jgi:hypothetical protein
MTLAEKDGEIAGPWRFTTSVQQRSWRTRLHLPIPQSRTVGEGPTYRQVCRPDIDWQMWKSAHTQPASELVCSTSHNW